MQHKYRMQNLESTRKILKIF